AIVSKLDNLGRDIKKLKENVHAIQVGCQLCDGPLLDKECPLNEDAKGFEEVKYREGRSSPFNGTKYRIGPPRYYTRVDNRPPYRKKAELGRTHEQALGRIGTKNLDFYAMAELGASINVMPKSMFEHLKLANLKETNMLVEMDDMTKKDVREYWASCNPYENECKRGNLPGSDVKHYWESTNDDERINLTWDNLSLNDWMKIRYGRICKSTKDRILKDHWKEKSGEEDDNTDEAWEDPEKCGEEKIDAILDTIFDKLGSFSKEVEFEVISTHNQMV
ncbi:hypothetical protein Tco_1342457, partial [Tanacetum coccineum]